MGAIPEYSNHLHTTTKVLTQGSAITLLFNVLNFKMGCSKPMSDRQTKINFSNKSENVIVYNVCNKLDLIEADEYQFKLYSFLYFLTDYIKKYL